MCLHFTLGNFSFRGLSQATRQLIVTADDLGLSPEVNQGILDAHCEGIITSASLLVNAPCTEAAVELARSTPDLEVGLHWSLVEGHCLLERECSLTDCLRYLGEPICLHRHWKKFVLRHLTGRIRMDELAEELELQAERFLTFFPSIPFANGTQHMHLLPGISELVASLSRKYSIGALRVPQRIIRTPGHNARAIVTRLMSWLGRRSVRALQGSAIQCTDAFAGFDMSGVVTADRVLGLLEALPEGVSELMVHPGLDCPALREGLPWGYHDFDWAGERAALMDPRVRKKIDTLVIRLIRFCDLQDESEY